MNDIMNPTVIIPDTAVPVVADTGEPVYRIPLGLCKQVVMKIDSAVLDILEINEDEEVDPDDKAMFTAMVDMLRTITANVVNIVKKEMDEDDFLAEDLAMDEIGPYPGDDIDILDQEVN